jgi:hypothetical protein
MHIRDGRIFEKMVMGPQNASGGVRYQSIVMLTSFRLVCILDHFRFPSSKFSTGHAPHTFKCVMPGQDLARHTPLPKLHKPGFVCEVITVPSDFGMLFPNVLYLLL